MLKLRFFAYIAHTTSYFNCNPVVISWFIVMSYVLYIGALTPQQCFYIFGKIFLLSTIFLIFLSFKFYFFFFFLFIFIFSHLFFFVYITLRECEHLLFPKKHTLAEVRCDQILIKACIVRCSDSEFSLWQIFYSTVRGLTKFKTRRSLSDEYDVGLD